MGEGFNAYIRGLQQETTIRQQDFMQKHQQAMQMASQVGGMIGSGIKAIKQATDHNNQYLAIAEKVGAFDPTKFAGKTPVDDELDQTSQALQTAQENTGKRIEELSKPGKGGSVSGKEVSYLSPDYIKALDTQKTTLERIQKIKDTLEQSKQTPEYQKSRTDFAQRQFLKDNPVGSPAYYKIMMDFQNGLATEQAQRKQTVSMKSGTEQSIPEVNQLQNLQNSLGNNMMLDEESKYNTSQKIEGYKQAVTQEPTKKGRADIVRQAQKEYNNTVIPEPPTPKKPGLFGSKTEKQKYKNYQDKHRAELVKQAQDILKAHNK